MKYYLLSLIFSLSVFCCFGQKIIDSINISGAYYHVDKESYIDSIPEGYRHWYVSHFSDTTLKCIFFYADKTVALSNTLIKVNTILKYPISLTDSLTKFLNTPWGKDINNSFNWGYYTLKNDTIIITYFIPGEVEFSGHYKVIRKMKIQDQQHISLISDSCRKCKYHYSMEYHNSNMLNYHPPKLYNFMLLASRPDSSLAWFKKKHWYKNKH